jgi:hypothetical protein
MAGQGIKIGGDGLRVADFVCSVCRVFGRQAPTRNRRQRGFCCWEWQVLAKVLIQSRPILAVVDSIGQCNTLCFN